MYKLLNFFKDKHGRIVLFQIPNWPLTLWFIFSIINLIWTNSPSRVHYLLHMLSFGFIFTWAWLEITSGINHFRRTLGVFVLIAICL